VSFGISPWVSDHRAVVSSFVLQPAPMPPLVTTDKRVYRDGDEIGIVLAGADGEVHVDRLDARGEASRIADLPEAQTGRLSLPADRFGAGRFALRLGEAAGREFWILAPDAVPAVEVEGDAFAAGATIPVRWRDGPGNRNDYLVIVDPREPPGYENYSTYAYVDALPEGQLGIGADTAECCWPLPPGIYVARLIRDDGAEVLAESAPFGVK